MNMQQTILLLGVLVLLIFLHKKIYIKIHLKRIKTRLPCKMLVLGFGTKPQPAPSMLLDS